MSRLGKIPVPVPEKVKVSVSGSTVAVEGPLGKLSFAIPSPVTVKVDEAKKMVLVDCKASDKQSKSYWGTTRSTINNMILGVLQGYEKQLEINAVGYNAKLQGKQLTMQLGYSHTVVMDIPPHLTVACPTQTLVSVKGADKQQVGEFAAKIRSKREVEPYNLKGIKYKDEVVRKKAGKTFVSGG